MISLKGVQRYLRIMSRAVTVARTKLILRAKQLIRRLDLYFKKMSISCKIFHGGYLIYVVVASANHTYRSQRNRSDCLDSITAMSFNSALVDDRNAVISDFDNGMLCNSGNPK